MRKIDGIKKTIDIKLVLTCLGYTIGIILAFCILLNSASVASGKKSAGDIEIGGFSYRPVIVVTGSMEPNIRTNSISILQYCGFDDVEVGDVILYQVSEGINITHRVIDKVDDGPFSYLTTKGDANSKEDDINITPDMVKGKLVSTFNWTADILNKVMVAPGMMNPLIVLQSIIFVVLFIALLVLVVKKLIDISKTIFWYFAKDETYNKRLNEFTLLSESHLDYVNNLREFNTVANKKGLAGLRYAILKYRILKQVGELKEDSRALDRAIKSFNKFKLKNKDGGKNNGI